MDELISRQVALDALAENEEMINAVLDSLTLDYNTRRNLEQRRGQVNEDIETIKELSTTEPKNGHWIKMSDRDGIYWACSECGEDIPRISHYDPQFDLFPRLESIDKTNYCPHCGAKMEC